MITLLTLTSRSTCLTRALRLRLRPVVVRRRSRPLVVAVPVVSSPHQLRTGSGPPVGLTPGGLAGWLDVNADANVVVVVSGVMLAGRWNRWMAAGAQCARRNDESLGRYRVCVVVPTPPTSAFCHRSAARNGAPSSRR